MSAPAATPKNDGCRDVVGATIAHLEQLLVGRGARPCCLDVQSPLLMATAERSEGRPRLLVFYSPTEGASRRFDGHLAQVLQRGGNHETFQVVRVDARARADLAERFGVTETPTILVADGGAIVGRAVQPRSTRQIRELLAPWLNGTASR